MSPPCVWVLASLTCIPNVGAYRMHGLYTTGWPLVMLPHGMLCLEDMPCTGMVPMLLNFLNKCVEKV